MLIETLPLLHKILVEPGQGLSEYLLLVILLASFAHLTEHREPVLDMRKCIDLVRQTQSVENFFAFVVFGRSENIITD